HPPRVERRAVSSEGCAMSQRRVAVVVPARDEAATIARCLASLYEQRGDFTLDIAVVANGCVDATAAEARRLVAQFEACGHRLAVIEQPRSSKPAALNAGDAQVDGDVRVYLDADAVLSPGAIAALCQVLLAGSSPRLATPRRVLQFAGRG